MVTRRRCDSEDLARLGRHVEAESLNQAANKPNTVMSFGSRRGLGNGCQRFYRFLSVTPENVGVLVSDFLSTIMRSTCTELPQVSVLSVVVKPTLGLGSFSYALREDSLLSEHRSSGKFCHHPGTNMSTPMCLTTND